MNWQVNDSKWMLLKDIKDMDQKKTKWVVRVFQNMVTGEVKFFDADYVDKRGTQAIIDHLNNQDTKPQEEVKTDASLEKVLEGIV